MTKPIWQPNNDRVQNAQISDFMLKVQKNNYPELYQWSIQQPEDFWKAVSAFCQIKFSKPYEKILQTGDRMIDARWFVGAELNFAEHLLRHQNNQIAIISYDENGKREQYTYFELYQSVAKCAEGLKELGVQKNDVVAGVMPNIAQTIIAMLATTSLGAIWTACSPDFGEAGILDRFSQVAPKILFAVESYTFKGKKIDCVDTVKKLQNKLPSLIKTIFLEKNWSALLNNPARKINFIQTPFNHPLYILYSSGTTGAPKCIVHGAGGTLIQHLKELILHTDLKSSDTLFYYTTCGWMMWHWMVSGLATGATLLLYEGSPVYPSLEHLWQIIAKEKVSIFGTSAKYISTLDKEKCSPKKYDLSALRTILSTGSPLLAQEFDYVYQDIKADLCLSSISGGTDIISCFALGCPILPVYRGELQCIGLGLNVKVFNEQGQPVLDEKGELVCTAPFPSMPIYFWNDPENVRYLHSYFDKFANIWAHGDFAKITTHDGLIIYGRSDAVLKPGGVRIGTAEIYRPVEKLPEVLECLAIGQPWQDDIRILLFVVLRPGLTLDEALCQKIRETIRHEASPRHVPAKIIQVNDLPRTINNKISELAVKQVVMGEQVTNLQAIANPESLKQFVAVGQDN
ncbi:MAG: acetoacetate--CoA ligase [Gammaproteobacteria bacterium]